MPQAITKNVIQGIPMSHIAMGLAVLILVLVLPALFNPKKFKHAMGEFFANHMLVRMSGVFALLCAFIILNTHWTIKLNSSRSIMTVLGYLAVLKGIARIWFPETGEKMVKKWMANETFYYVGVGVALLIGLGVGYLGWFVY